MPLSGTVLSIPEKMSAGCTYVNIFPSAVIWSRSSNERLLQAICEIFLSCQIPETIMRKECFGG